MHIFSYRNRRAMRKTLLIIGAVAAFLLILVIGRMIYVQRFIKYSPDGATLDYNQSLTYSGQTEPARDPADFPFETVVESERLQEDSAEPAQPQPLKGYYISTSMLVTDFSNVEQSLSQLEDYNAVMIDVKSIYGNYYYSTNITGAPRTDAVDPKKVDALIKKLSAQNGVTLIARVPAFSDRNYALAHQTEGLPLSSGALWEGEDLCYWLNPASAQVQGYLVSIGIELSQQGFDEVVFDDFFCPTTESIIWHEELSREEAVAEAAEAIKDSLYGYGIRIDFGSGAPDVAKFSDRIMVSSESPEDVEDFSAQYAEVLEDPASQIVFVTDSRDTRFESCGVLRPLLEKAEEA